MCQNCCTLRICSDLKYVGHLRPNIQSIKSLILYTEVPSPNAEQVLRAKIIFSFTLLPQIRQNNEDLRNLACGGTVVDILKNHIFRVKQSKNSDTFLALLYSEDGGIVILCNIKNGSPNDSITSRRPES